MMRRIIIILAAFLVTGPLLADDFQYHGSFLWNGVRAIKESNQFLYCAFPDGIGVVNLELDFSKKKLYSTLEMPHRPFRLYLCDDLLIAEDEAGEFSVIDISDPLKMSLLGSFRPTSEIVDICRIDNYLYAAMQYDGLFRYDISVPENIIFDDSSLVGIHVTRLALSDSLLFVLDDYNGVLIYQPNQLEIGPPLAELLLPHQGISLTVSGDSLFSGLFTDGLMVGIFTDLHNPEYLGLTETFIRADKIDLTPQGMVLSNSLSGFELIYGQGDNIVDQIFPIEGIWGTAIVIDYQSGKHIMYPHKEKGFVGYNIENPDLIELRFPIITYSSPGPITQLSFVNSRLHSIGTHNWYEIFDLSDPNNPVRTGKIINPPYVPAGMCSKGDTLFMADIELNAVFSALDYGVGDPTIFFPFFIINDSISRPFIIPDYFPDGDLIYYYDNIGLRGTFRNDTLVKPNLFDWRFPTGVTSVNFYDTIVYVNNDKGIMSILAIDENYYVSFVDSRTLPGRGAAMVRVDTMLYIGSNDLLTYSVANAVAPARLYINTAPSTINDIIQVDSWLIVAARNGIHIYDISFGRPQLIFSGAGEAKHVAFYNNIIATSDGYSVKIYSLPILDTDDDSQPLPNLLALPQIAGYPNPFNPSIRLDLTNFRSVGEPVVIDIYDILGRRIKKLELRTDHSGSGEISWDGTDFDSRNLASGIYFFRASQGQNHAVFKAILLK